MLYLFRQVWGLLCEKKLQLIGAQLRGQAHNFTLKGHRRRLVTHSRVLSLSARRLLFTAREKERMVPGCVTNAQSDGWAWNRKIFKELLEIINCDKISLPFCNTLKEQFNLMCRLALDSLSLSLLAQGLKYANVVDRKINTAAARRPLVLLLLCVWRLNCICLFCCTNCRLLQFAVATAWWMALCADLNIHWLVWLRRKWQIQHCVPPAKQIVSPKWVGLLKFQRNCPSPRMICKPNDLENLDSNCARQRGWDILNLNLPVIQILLPTLFVIILSKYILCSQNNIPFLNSMGIKILNKR